jgi:hypothetical protein
VSSVVLVVGRRWGGAPLPREGRTELRLAWEDAHLRVDVDAPFAGDPPPPGPAGSTDRLWEHEVVELFVVRPDGSYVELELSPHGHFLLLELSGVRVVARRGLPVHGWAPALDPARGRYTGTARIDRALFPERPVRCNAFRLAGAGPSRSFELFAALPGETPDFHQPDRFPPWLV